MLKILLMPFVALFIALTLATGVAAQGYNIRSGDTLLLEVLEDASLNRSLLVLPDGNVSVPQVGSVRAAGRTIDQVRSAVAAGLASNFAAAPTVYMSVSQLATRVARTAAAEKVISVYTIGEVAKPGKVDVAPGTTLLQFLAESGGLTKFAASKRIQLRRTDAKTGREAVYGYNFSAVMAGAVAPMIVLREGDVIVVPQRHLFE